MASTKAEADPTVFSLENKSLKLDTADDLTPHLPLLTASPDTITSVRLQGNTLGAPFSAALGPHLSKLKNLTTANLADIFTSRLLSEIPPALDSLLTSLLPLQALHTVDLSDNAFGLNTQAPLVAFLRQHAPLQHLILSNNGLGPDAGARVAKALSELAAAQHAAGSPGLQTVVCGRNRLENGSMAAWAGALAAHAGSLRTVKMVQNGIRAEGVQVLLREGLGHAKGLRVLDLQDNTFTGAGATALAEVMVGWAELKELGVGDCLLSARGFARVVEALRKGTVKELEVLRCQYDEIDAKGVKALAELVAAREGAEPVLAKLRRVELNGNKFAEEDPAVDMLKEALDERREKAGPDWQEGVDAEWGLDDLSDLEDESDEDEDDEDEDDEDDEDTDGKADSLLKQADEAENENVAQEKDADVDALADKLDKTEL